MVSALYFSCFLFVVIFLMEFVMTLTPIGALEILFGVVFSWPASVIY